MEARMLANVKERPVIFAKEGARVIFRLPEAGKSGLPSGFAFSMHKAGSTLLFNIIEKICKIIDLQYVSIMDEAFIKGFRSYDLSKDVSKIFFTKGYFYGGFRVFPFQFNIPTLAQSKKIFLIRDPRDMLVSFYFSVVKSHLLPEKGKMRDQLMNKRDCASVMNIDEFVIDRSDKFCSWLIGYKKLLAQDKTRVYRYEDIVYNKRSWAEDIIDFFSWPVRRQQIPDIADPFDIIPESENINEHIRQVHPGNHKKKLKADTTLYLTEKFKPYLQMFSYEI
jgi:hypothetical protein